MASRRKACAQGKKQRFEMIVNAILQVVDAYFIPPPHTHAHTQEEQRLERQEDRLHHKAVNAALHGNIGKAVALEVSWRLA